MSVQHITVVAIATALIGGLTEIRGSTTPAVPQNQASAPSDAEWCDESGWSDDREHVCEIRELTATGSSLAITDNPNGSIAVTGGNRQDIRIRARVRTSANTEADARAIAGEVRVSVSNGRIETDGPRRDRDRSWSVSYRVDVPTRTNLELGSSNGSITVASVDGDISASTSNGSLRLTDLAGDVEGRSSNGSVQVMLSGDRWDGAGLDVRTSNGSASIDIPESYNARLVGGTRNGSMRVDFPITVNGRINRNFDTTLGSGGATIRVETSNGSVRIRRRQ